ncbi:MAG: ribonuclease PH [Spirochaetes bacterium]|nr:MAG: ribonuclease PH [Spirochaetota bacterium]
MAAVRPIRFERNYIMSPAGSCLASFGNTRVLCTCTIEDGTPPYVKSGAWLTAEYAMLPGSVSVGRKKRDGVKRDGRSVEIQRLIGRSLRAAVNLKALPEVTLTVDCDVIQADGGTRTAAISGGWVALVDALGVLAADSPGVVGLPEGWLLGQVAAVSVGIVDGNVVCDLDYQADRNAEVDMNVVSLDGNYVEIQGTGENGTFSRSQLDELLSAADDGITAIVEAQSASLGIEVSSLKKRVK